MGKRGAGLQLFIQLPGFGVGLQQLLGQQVGQSVGVQVALFENVGCRAQGQIRCRRRHTAVQRSQHTFCGRTCRGLQCL